MMRVLETCKHFGEFKSDFLEWLKKNNVYINKTELTTSRNCAIGCLVNSHPLLSHRVSTGKELHHRIQTDINFQLVPRIQKSGLNSTRALTIECTISDTQELSQKFMEKCVASGDLYLHTREMRFVPQNPRQNITREILTAMVRKQNDFLFNFIRITVVSKS